MFNKSLVFFFNKREKVEFSGKNYDSRDIFKNSKFQSIDNSWLQKIYKTIKIA